MPAQKIGNITSTTTQKTNRQEKPTQIIIKSGDTLSGLAQKFGMSAEEFKVWTGMKSSTVKLGQKITLPYDTVPEGRGIFALIRKYGMTLEEFGKLNNLPKPYKEYTASKGEHFYVKKHETTRTQSTKPQASTSQTQPKHTTEAPTPQHAKAAAPKKPKAPVRAAKMTPTQLNKAKWGSSYSPQELASKIYEGSKAIGAVGKPDFDALINEINPKNVDAVLKAYTKDETLVHTLIREVTSKKESREKAVMKVYNALATAKGYTNEQRKEFATELHKQLYDVWGLASSKNLDKMINGTSAASQNAKAAQKAKCQTLPHLQRGNINDKRVVTVQTGTLTAGKLYKDAKEAGKKEATKNFKEYCKENKIKYDEKALDFSPMERYPAPVIKNGKLVMMESALLKPTGKPNGKVIILNAGHGGYSTVKGTFDPGSYSFIKKANGKYVPLLEYEKAQIYSESMAQKLRAQGYAVVMTSGHKNTMADNSSMSNLVANLNSGKKGGQKYSNKDIMMISLHADSSPNAKGSAVCFQPGTKQDAEAQAVLRESLNKDDWISARKEPRVWGTNGVGILNQTKNIPSLLLEIEYVNGCKSQNLDSKAYQERFENKTIDGINKYFKGYRVKVEKD